MVINEKAVFVAALELRDIQKREAYLQEACAGCPEMLGRLRELLSSHDESLGPLDRGPAELGVTLDKASTERPGTMVGPYKLMEEIGAGGFGLVFVAEQQQPVRRKVALKVIKPGMDTREVIARFEAERQALALMDHPNIARVLDAGTTPSGRPCFVMELVKGVPITQFCDDHRLTPRERLDLFVNVCQAVQHAHQKGIIHRDVKPSNVLVTSHDGTPVVKVIDFGVAKAIGQRLTEKTIYTGHTQMLGTPQYMSPEQAGMSGLDIDTRTDIYALGVLLYELLTGTTPFDTERLRTAGYDEIRRIIREEEPPKPSTRISTLGQAAATVSANRRSDPQRLSWLVRGELDWIVMKALEKDRNRRYETANSFCRDVQRYLADEPVQACPPSGWYRFRKLARRNRAALLTASLVAASLVAGAVVATWQAVVATGAKQDALDAKQDALAAAAAATTAKETAEKREAETVAVLKFVVDKILAAARPKGQKGGLGHDVKLREAVAAAVPFVETSFTKEPLIEARLRMTVGQSFLFLGDAKSAGEQFQKARTLYVQHRGPDHPDALLSMIRLANSYAALGRPADARTLYEETLALHKAQLGPDHPDTLLSMHNLANSYYALGRPADARTLYEETLARRKAQLGSDHPDTLQTMNNLAISYAALGRQQDALRLREETLALRRARLGPDHPETLGSMNNLANSYGTLGRHQDALKLHEETLALRRAQLGPDHPETLRSMSSLANSYAALGRHQDALKLREETLAGRRAKLDPDHPDTLLSMYYLALSYTALGRHADALKLHAETLARRKAKLGPDHPDTLYSMHNLANTYHDLGRHTDALRLREETLALRKAQLGPDHPDTLASMGNLANTYHALGRHTDALRLREETLALQKARLSPDHPDTLMMMNNLALSYTALGRHADALKLHAETLARRNAKLGPDHPETLKSLREVAVCLVRLDRGAEAVPVVDDCVARAAGKAGDPNLIPAVMDLRLRHFEKARDAAGCRATAEKWEALNRTDAPSLYTAARMRAVTAAVIRQGSQPPGGGASGPAEAEADRAMEWLRKAVNAGERDAGRIAADEDFTVLRGREDFNRLLGEMEKQ